MTGVATGPDAMRVSASSVDVIHLRAGGAPAGCEVVAVAARTGAGIGVLRNVGVALQWKAPGSSLFGAAVSVPSDDTYLVRDGDDADKWVRVQVFTAFLAGPSRADVELWETWNNAVASDDVDASEASAGDVEAYSVDLDNDGNAPLHNVVAWIDAAVSGIDISLSGAGPWVAPTNEATGLAIPDLAVGGSDTLHVRRTIGAGASADPAVETLLHFAYTTAS
jgi:hypothetical protein